MAKSNAEHQREWRRKRRDAKKAAIKQQDAPALASVMRTPFYEWTEQDGNWTDFDMALDQAGFTPPSFNDDTNPGSATGEIEPLFADDPSASPYVEYPGSLGRAEMMVGCLISAAVTLAGSINDYKQSEIRSRIAEIEQADLTDPIAKKQALADIVRLQKMLDQLSKQVRWTFPQWKVKGE